MLQFAPQGRKNLVNAASIEDLVKRRFTADAPDVLWLTDITEHPTAEGKLYCGAVPGAFSRRIIGWSIGKRQDTNLVVNALAMAVTRRQPESDSTILHSDGDGGGDRVPDRLCAVPGQRGARTGSAVDPGALLWLPRFRLETAWHGHARWTTGHRQRSGMQSRVRGARRSRNLPRTKPCGRTCRTGSPARILNVTGLDRMLPVYAATADAIAAVAAAPAAEAEAR